MPYIKARTLARLELFILLFELFVLRQAFLEVVLGF